MAVYCMRTASGDKYRNSSFMADEAVGQIPRSTERISSFNVFYPTTKVLSSNKSQFVTY